MAVAAILKIKKSRYLPQRVDRSFGTLMQNGSLNRSDHEKSEFHKSKMAEGRNVHCRPAGHILVMHSIWGMVRA